ESGNISLKVFRKSHKKSVARFRAFDHTASQYGYPRAQIVAAALGKLRDQVFRPVLRARFPTIVNDVFETAFAHQRAHRTLIVVKISRHIRLDMLGIELVYFRAGSFGRSGMVRYAGERISEAQDGPST